MFTTSAKTSASRPFTASVTAMHRRRRSDINAAAWLLGVLLVALTITPRPISAAPTDPIETIRCLTTGECSGPKAQPIKDTKAIRPKTSAKR